MSRSTWQQIKVRQAVAIKDEPDAPRIFERSGKVYALWRLVEAVAGPVLAALAVSAGMGPERWRGAAVPWLAERG